MVNGCMKPSAFAVMGVTAPSARLTPLGAALLAIVAALPGGLAVSLIGWWL
jgi:hypothetical protein